MTANFKRLSEFAKFFGCPFEEVNKTIQLIALYGDDPLPSWMQGRTSWEQLPRVTDRTCEYIQSVALLRDRDIALRVQWVIESLEGGWCLNEDGLSFEKMLDAVHYKLRWGGVGSSTPANGVRLRMIR